MRRLIRSEFRKLTTTKMPLALLGVLILFAIINAFIVIAFASNGFILAALFGAIAVTREDGNHTVIPTFLAELGSRAADITDASDARRVISGASVGFQCAGPPCHRWAEEFPPLQRSVLNACASANAPLTAAENVYGVVATGVRPRLRLVPAWQLR